jgi:hypothetical protein
MLGLVGLCLGSGAAWGQNVVFEGRDNRVAPRVDIRENEALALVENRPAIGSIPHGAAGARTPQRLNSHVVEMLDAWPLRPFHHTLGISGSETCFGHPDQLYYCLATALPYLDPPVRQRTRDFLRHLLHEHPPFARRGFDPRRGAARESYRVPEDLRVQDRATARSLFGVYAFEVYVNLTADLDAAIAHWPSIRDRVQPILEDDYKFDVDRTDYDNDQAEVLNGDLAGLIAAVRLARLVKDSDAERQAVSRLRELLVLRVNLERVNPQIVQRTRSATKTLHVFKLARYCDLVPELGQALARHTEGCAVDRLRSFRELRNGWYLAFGDRLIGGENYTNPLHFSRALFAGAALVERRPASELFTFIDVPWCRGDLYYIEKCALALQRFE